MTGQKIDNAGMNILWLRLRRPRLTAGSASGMLVYLLFFLLSSMPGRLRLSFPGMRACWWPWSCCLD